MRNKVTARKRILSWLQKIIFCCGLFPLLAQAENVALKAVRLTPVNNTVRMTLILNKAVEPRLFVLSKPDRLVIDLQNTQLKTALTNLSLATTPIKNIRVGHPVTNTLRLVLDLQAKTRFKVISAKRTTQIILALEASKPASYVAELKLPPESRVAPIVVVVDAGHGGKDSGAIGASGTKEKYVTLAIAKQLAELINQQPNMRAVLTRKGDYFVSLRNRLKLARKGNADLFIAIHADSYFNNQAGGASVYALSQHGATSEAAHWLARRENYSELGGVDLRELGDQSYLLRSVLIDLAQTATITDSLHLGKTMLRSLENVTRLHYLHVEQAPFMVLKSPDIPSILVETGFISNSNEELRLRDPFYQNKLAQAILTGIQGYLTQYAVKRG